MYIAYVDESGDDGVKKGSSKSYALSCVMVRSDAWAETFDQMIDFRRFVRRSFGIPVRAEIKASYLLRNSGPLAGNPLSEEARRKLYRGFMRLQPKLEIQTFAVVVDKKKATKKFATARPTSDVAWEYLLQRLERRATKERTEILVVHDEGDAVTVRKRARKARRAGTAGSAMGTGTLTVPFTRLLDDPVARDSRQSYFLQLADLNAYAAFRRLYKPPKRLVQIVPQTMWDELGAARFRQVRAARFGDPPGIVPGP